MTTADDEPGWSAATLSASAAGSAPAGRAGTESADDRARRSRLPTPAEDDGLTKKLVKQKLFPRRAGPVKLGRFAVLGRLGDGGMGIVYACYDDRLDRKVAVKVLRSDTGRDPTIARARLMREAQAMARLTHPNIVTVHEVGAVGDEVFVAMEFVRGTGLDAWVEREARPWRAVLAAYLQAGRGLEAAHRGGIIHRDFKAQNAIITEDGLVKVLDFGLARATDAALADEAVSSAPEGELAGRLTHSLTRTGVVMGTPAYMAPEQHLGEPTTAASDQFSFCVSLYQSLYGQLPFSTASLYALRADALAGTIAPPPAGTQVPARLFKILRRGMAVQPEARHPSMTALLAELERVAGTGRRRMAIAAASGGLVVAASVLASAMLAPPPTPTCPDAQVELAGIWDQARAETVRSLVTAIDAPYAAQAWATIEPQLDRWAAQWVALRNEACQTHAEARQSDQLFDLRTACLDQRRAGFAGVIDVLASTDAAGLPGAVEAVAKLPALERCADAAALTAVVPPPEARARARVQGLREALARAAAQESAGRYAAGIEAVRGMLPEVDALAYEPLRAEALLRLGSLEMEAGDPAAADAALEQALWTAIAVDHAPVAAQASSKRVFLRAARRGQPAAALAELPWAQALNQRVRGDVALYAEFLNNVGVVYAVAGEPADARRGFEAALELRERGGQGGTLDQLWTLSNLGQLALHEGRSLEAVELVRRVVTLSRAVLGEQHPARLRNVIALARGLLAMGRPQEVRALLAPLTASLEASDNGELRAMAQQCFGDIALAERDVAEARRRYESGLPACPAGSDCADEIVGGLGRALAQQGDEAAVRARFTAALAGLAAAGAGAGDRRYLAMQVRFGRALAELGRAAEAAAQIEPALARCSGEADELPPLFCAWVRRQSGEALQAAGQAVAAERALALALAGFQQSLPPQSLDIADVQRALGELALAAGRFDEARERLRQAEAIYAALAEPDHAPLASARLALARAMTGSAGAATPEARALAEQALAAFTAKGPRFASERDVAHTWLEGHP